MPDGGMGYRATYQLPGQPEVVMEFKKKSQEISVGIRKETSLDNHRTDIKADSSHQGGSRLISEADLASIGMDNHQDTRSHSDMMESSPSSSKEGLVAFAIFLGGSPC